MEKKQKRSQILFMAGLFFLWFVPFAHIAWVKVILAVYIGALAINGVSVLRSGFKCIIKRH